MIGALSGSFFSMTSISIIALVSCALCGPARAEEPGRMQAPFERQAGSLVGSLLQAEGTQGRSTGLQPAPRPAADPAVAEPVEKLARAERRIRLSRPRLPGESMPVAAVGAGAASVRSPIHR